MLELLLFLQSLIDTEIEYLKPYGITPDEAIVNAELAGKLAGEKAAKENPNFLWAYQHASREAYAKELQSQYEIYKKIVKDKEEKFHYQFLMNYIQASKREIDYLRWLKKNWTKIKKEHNENSSPVTALIRLLLLLPVWVKAIKKDRNKQIIDLQYRHDYDPLGNMLSKLTNCTKTSILFNPKILELCKHIKIKNNLLTISSDSKGILSPIDKACLYAFLAYLQFIGNKASFENICDIEDFLQNAYKEISTAKLDFEKDKEQIKLIDTIFKDCQNEFKFQLIQDYPYLLQISQQLNEKEHHLKAVEVDLHSTKKNLLMIRNTTFCLGIFNLLKTFDPAIVDTANPKRQIDEFGKIIRVYKKYRHQNPELKIAIEIQHLLPQSKNLSEKQYQLLTHEVGFEAFSYIKHQQNIISFDNTPGFLERACGYALLALLYSLPQNTHKHHADIVCNYIRSSIRQLQHYSYQYTLDPNNKKIQYINDVIQYVHSRYTEIIKSKLNNKLTKFCETIVVQNVPKHKKAANRPCINAIHAMSNVGFFNRRRLKKANKISTVVQGASDLKGLVTPFNDLGWFPGSQLKKISKKAKDYQVTFNTLPLSLGFMTQLMKKKPLCSAEINKNILRNKMGC